MASPVCFFGRRHWLSNFFECDRRIVVECDGSTLVASTSEALYQALKFPADSEARRCILAAATPGEAKKLGGRRGFARHHCEMRDDWDDVKLGVMRTVLRAKFSDPDLRARLLATGDAPLIEASPYDAYWGWGRSKCGHNHLGRLLCELRDELRRGAQ